MFGGWGFLKKEKRFGSWWDKKAVYFIYSRNKAINIG
jgi:hypothetical protein